MQYGSFIDGATGIKYIAGDIVDLTPAAADFLGDQVEPAPNASSPSIDIDEVVEAAGYEVSVGDIESVESIADRYGPSDNKNTIDVTAISERYETQSPDTNP